MYYFSSGTWNLHKTYKVSGRHAVLLMILTKSSVRLPPPGWLSWKSGAGVLHTAHSLSCTTPAPPTTSFLSSKPSLALTDKKNSMWPSLVPIHMGPRSSGTGLCPTGWSLHYSCVQPVQCSCRCEQRNCISKTSTTGSIIPSSSSWGNPAAWKHLLSS